VGGIPKADAFAAFDYYINNYNNGRPFILAGHSQGSNVLVYLLAKYMKAHPDVQKRMVAAYVIGYSVTDETLATAEQGLGSTLPNSNLKFIPVGKYADAQIDKTKDVLVCSTADVTKLSPGNAVFGKGVFHSFDYPFYFFNIRENADNRVKYFLNK
jgi:hypothetical protein